MHGEEDVVISGLRLHDNTYGDVEIDLILLLPNAGVGIVEVKGGTITYADGAWHQTLRTRKNAERTHGVGRVRLTIFQPAFKHSPMAQGG